MIGMFRQRRSEPGAPADAKVADVDRRLEAIARTPSPLRSPAQQFQADRLLDLRNSIRPARPS
jgi:hypothetical protein